eukprot:jgi/Psemu1/209748/e_gw1.511.3.1
MSAHNKRPTAIRAVRCHRFACVEEKSTDQKDNESFKIGEKRAQATTRTRFQRRLPKALRLKDCLSLDHLPYPSDHAVDNKTRETRVLIRTEYVGIQYPDALQAQGLYQVKPRLPYVPGMDVVGIVTKVIPPENRGKETENYSNGRTIQPGDRVLAVLMDFGGTGGLSEIVVASLKHVHKLPAHAEPQSYPVQSAAVFANIGRNYFAAYHALVEVGYIRPNDPEHNSNKVVLVTGASGGVGMATIELAKAMGCRIIAGVGSPSKRNGPASVGADAVFSYGRSKAERKQFRKQVLGMTRSTGASSFGGVDLVVDVVMGDLFEEALVGCLKPLGTIALVGFAAGQKPIRPGILLVKEARVAGSIWGHVALEASEDSSDNKYRRMVETILGYFASGAIRGRVDRIVPLSNFIEAFEIFEENRGRGNTVVSFADHLGDGRENGQATTRSRL